MYSDKEKIGKIGDKFTIDLTDRKNRTESRKFAGTYTLLTNPKKISVTSQEGTRYALSQLLGADNTDMKHLLDDLEAQRDSGFEEAVIVICKTKAQLEDIFENKWFYVLGRPKHQVCKKNSGIIYNT